MKIYQIASNVNATGPSPTFQFPAPNDLTNTAGTLFCSTNGAGSFATNVECSYDGVNWVVAAIFNAVTGGRSTATFAPYWRLNTQTSTGGNIANAWIAFA